MGIKSQTTLNDKTNIVVTRIIIFCCYFKTNTTLLGLFHIIVVLNNCIHIILLLCLYWMEIRNSFITYKFRITCGFFSKPRRGCVNTGRHYWWYVYVGNISGKDRLSLIYTLWNDFFNNDTATILWFILTRQIQLRFTFSVYNIKYSQFYTYSWDAGIHAPCCILLCCRCGRYT